MESLAGRRTVSALTAYTGTPIRVASVDFAVERPLASVQRYMSTMQQTDTLIPASYPELMDEQWGYVAGESARDTLIPSSGEQLTLELACAAEAA